MAIVIAFFNLLIPATHTLNLLVLVVSCDYKHTDDDTCTVYMYT